MFRFTPIRSAYTISASISITSYQSGNLGRSIITCSDWLLCITWCEYSVLIGCFVSRGESTVLWLIDLYHVVWVQCSDWLFCITWCEYSALIGCFVSYGVSTVLWLIVLYHVVWVQCSDWLFSIPRKASTESSVEEAWQWQHSWVQGKRRHAALQCPAWLLSQNRIR